MQILLHSFLRVDPFSEKECCAGMQAVCQRMQILPHRVDPCSEEKNCAGMQTGNHKTRVEPKTGVSQMVVFPQT